ncbi:MAG: 30S ribosome-binding factor RbfA [Erysipelotrichales bacterium]|nr:30S ribosome-binding factor RbfA [Erysipelotrichales bacterium]MBQ1386642.1 30S ribosome-binding factor RbfA [Erysipelotrichales bacterium]MBQ2310019.1 30S ribosome-binding factor RbfA [Erysipelotrichales bacterium]MBQ2478095.1 30S ribosome-binding factor RbfA [Erysipelotrichales bacterium]MBQ4012055.1 30S ribosome-binding factor RbfA [Erysipelotrichales bacterium]
MSRVKKERLESIISRDLSEIIQFELKSPEIGFVTVTGVSLTNDYSIAKVYVTVLGNADDIKEQIEALKESKGFIRSRLAGRLSIRKCPDLIFLEDTSLATGNRIESILEGLHKEVE